MSSLVHTSRGEAAPAARRLFAGTLLATLGVRLGLAWAFPVIGDEAYLFTWARAFAGGYYDHPPMAAWLLRPLVALGLDSPFALRLPAVAIYPLLALVLVRLLRPYGEPEAYLGGTLFLLVPGHVLGVLMVTDVPLVLFSGLAGAALFRAAGGGGAEREGRREPLAWYAAAGIFLGLAFLSKYLAALLAAAVLVWFATGERHRRRLPGLALVVLCALPFVLQHLAWNAEHCWATVLFNVYSRHAGESKNYSVPRNIFFFIFAHLYLATPVLLWYLGRHRRRLLEVAREPAFRFAALAFAVPMVLLLASAVTAVFGIYWVLPFYPFLFLLVPRVLPRREMLRTVRFLAVFTGIQAAALGVAVALPLEAWRGSGFHDSLVTMERTEELLARLEEVEPAIAGLPGASGSPSGLAERSGRTRLAASGYSLASLLAYRSGEPVLVFGAGSHYARQDDLWTDYRELDGGDVLLVSKRPVGAASFDPYFREVARTELPFHGTTLHLAIGRGFEFERYRQGVLTGVRERYYRIPEWLPTRGCPFCERYFGASDCR